MPSQSQSMFAPSPAIDDHGKLTARNSAWDSVACDHPPAALALEPGDLRILIVNEDMGSANSLKLILHELGYHTIYTAYSARRALEAADELSPALALLDLELPDMNGFQLAKALRAHRHRHVREMSLLAVAERLLPGEGTRTRAAGFIGCVTKPVPLRELHRLMRTLGR